MTGPTRTITETSCRGCVHADEDSTQHALRCSATPDRRVIDRAVPGARGPSWETPLWCPRRLYETRESETVVEDLL